MNKFSKFCGLILASPVFIPVIVRAAAPTSVSEASSLVSSSTSSSVVATDWEARFSNVSNFSDFVTVFWGYAAQIIFTLSVLTIITGGVIYVASEGADEKVNIAKDIIKGAIISIILVIISGSAINMLLEKPSDGSDPLQYNSTFRVLNNTSSMLIGLAGGFTVVMLMINGFKYITAAGDEDKISQARKGMSYSLIGLVVCVSAFVIVKNVIGFF